MDTYAVIKIGNFKFLIKGKQSLKTKVSDNSGKYPKWNE
jgi:hypothetical protein